MNQLSQVELKGKDNSREVKKLSSKLEKVERRNKSLETENSALKEKLNDIEYRQQRNNLIFEGVSDSQNETDLECAQKLCLALKNVPILDHDNFKIERCHRLDGTFKPNLMRRVICCFNWHYDAQCVLKGQKHLPLGIYVSEDLPEEWVDCPKILKPIFNAARRNESLKSKTFLSKDKLIISGKTFSAGMNPNYLEASTFVDVPSTCQRTDSSKMIFFGMHSVFSNLHPASFAVNNVKYNCVEQMIQSEKASLFNDDATQAKIMAEANPYNIKKFGNHVKNFSLEKWRKHDKQIAYSAVAAKFSQNDTLKQIFCSTGSAKIAESSADVYWGPDSTFIIRMHWMRDTGQVMVPCVRFTLESDMS